MSDSDLIFQPASEECPAIGKVEFQHALMEKVKIGITNPPPREELAFTLRDDTIGIDIDTSITKVYELLIDLEN